MKLFWNVCQLLKTILIFVQPKNRRGLITEMSNDETDVPPGHSDDSSPYGTPTSFDKIENMLTGDRRHELGSTGCGNDSKSTAGEQISNADSPEHPLTDNSLEDSHKTIGATSDSIDKELSPMESSIPPQPTIIDIDEVETQRERLLSKFDSAYVGPLVEPPTRKVAECKFELHQYSETANTKYSCWHDCYPDQVLDMRDHCDSDLLVSGDIHGDIVAFEAVINYWQRQPDTTKLVLLGDFIDRGFFDDQVIKRLKYLVAEHGENVLVIAGNHDVALSYDEESNQFKSSVEPSEYKDQLNKWTAENISETTAQLEDARWFIDFMRTRPLAAFVGGVLLTHGGFPRLEGTSVNVLQDRLSDYTWNRLAEYPTRLIDYSSRTSEFGSKDFELFRQQCADQHISLSIVVRGHDHVISELEAPRGIRHSCPGAIRRGDFERRIHTINSMCYLHDGELSPFSSIREVSPAVVHIKWKEESGQKKPIVEVIELEIDKHLIDNKYKRCPVCHRTCWPNEPCHTLPPIQSVDE